MEKKFSKLNKVLGTSGLLERDNEDCLCLEANQKEHTAFIQFVEDRTPGLAHAKQMFGH